MMARLARALDAGDQRISTDPKKVFVFFFAAAFASHLWVIDKSPFLDNWIDVSIYMDGADLVRHGVNPYTFGDSVQLRTRLRLDSVAFDGYTSADQARWNSYAASNPPLSLLFYRAIAAVSFTSRSFRIAFALVDAVLAGAIALFILRFWGPDWTASRFGSALFLGAFSPVLFKWGALRSEDKGLEILLMIVAVYLSRSRSTARAFYLSAFVLGCSIAFKILGAFLVPICLKYAVYDRSERSDRGRNVKALTYLLIAGASCLVWFVPFLPGVVTTMVERFQSTASSGGAPIHGSPWRLLSEWAPNAWKTTRLLVMSGLMILIGLGVRTKRLTVEASAISVLVIYVCLFLTGGSGDRMNMALLPAVLILGSMSEKGSVGLAAAYVVAGGLATLHFTLYYTDRLVKLPWPLWTDTEMPDAFFAAVMVIAIFAAVLSQFLSSGSRAAMTRRELSDARAQSA